jgi:hypothetical protein
LKLKLNDVPIRWIIHSLLSIDETILGKFIFRGDLSHVCISETEALKIQIYLSTFFFWRDICTTKFAPDRFLALTWQYDLISFTLRAGALEIQNRADNGLKDDTHQVSTILD